ncbi:hypothetical protein OPW32_19625 [Vibrio europaeus]|uniref:hypothetical protein n=1 Tax=Vibrio europaeus TaxID=300876 RepID=UPI002340333D|nr:hypothetical protein [Vibrio europaeus]MDC5851399.1 hypothetical protein [Vibrio europaeus]
MTTERILSFSSVVIAICAVCVSLWQGMVTREHNRLSLKPYLVSAPELPGVGGQNGIFLSNHGGGPAFINNIEITANGKTFDLTKNSWSDLYQHLGIKSLCHYESYIPKGSALKSGQKVKLLAPTNNPIDPNCPVQFIELLTAPELDLFVEYQSVYEDTYIYSQRIGLGAEDSILFKKLFGF